MHNEKSAVREGDALEGAVPIVRDGFPVGR